MLVKCIKDTEGYWTEGDMYPACNSQGGFNLVGDDELHSEDWRAAMSIDTEELKPCPFCGSKNIEAFFQFEEDCPHQSAIVRCFECDAQSAQMVGKDKIGIATRAWIDILPALKGRRLR